MKLSIIIPIFNEKATILRVLERLQLVPIEKEIIIIDDCSTDGSRDLLIEENKKNNNFELFLHDRNMGKGACLRTGLSHINGNYTIIQDADLEQDPQDLLKLLEPIEKEGCEAVFGTRVSYWKNGFDIRYLANKLFALITNFLYKTNLSDIMTGYKLINCELLKSLDLKSRGFSIESEITAKLLKRKIRIVEVPIKYTPRGYKEGKKIRAKDSFSIIYYLIKTKFR